METFLYPLAVLCLVPIIFLMERYGIVLGPKKIKNLPMVESWPFIGSIFEIFENPCLKFLEWGNQYDSDVLQVKLGSKNIVVANSYNSIRELWLKNSTANNSRPILYTFHKVLSRGEIFTVGTTPFGDSFKKKRKYLSTNLHKKVVDGYSHLISTELDCVINQLEFELRNFPNGEDFSFLRRIQVYTLKLSLQLTYSFEPKRLSQDLAEEIIDVENRIVQMRSHFSNVQDYVPMWRFVSHGTNLSLVDLSRRRLKYMNMFFQHTVTASWNRPCLVNNVLNDKHRDISVDELKSICLTMVSAGLDNVGLNLDHCIGQLAKNPKIQERAYREIIKKLVSKEAGWKECLADNFKCDYVTALIRETLRYFTVLPLSLPRATTKKIHYRDSIIESGTILFMNAYGGNHDESHFPRSFEFIPERYLDENYNLVESYNSNNGRRNHNQDQGIPSFSFGVGSRMCAGNHLLFKQMYILLVKLIMRFEFSESENEMYVMELEPLKLNKDPRSIAIEPRDFKVHVRVRDRGEC